MSKVTCDICGTELEYNHMNTAGFYGLTGRMADAKDGNYLFDFEVRVTNYRFNATNFHVCRQCIMNAVVARIKL